MLPKVPHIIQVTSAGFEVTEIFPSEGLSIITDTHLIIAGLHPITYGCPIRMNREGEWISTDNCECIVDRQKDGVRHQLGKFTAIVDDAKEAYYTSKLKRDMLFPSSSEEESNEGGLISCLNVNLLSDAVD
jgi:hypothetical protein